MAIHKGKFLIALLGAFLTSAQGYTASSGESNAPEEGRTASTSAAAGRGGADTFEALSGLDLARHLKASSHEPANVLETMRLIERIGLLSFQAAVGHETWLSALTGRPGAFQDALTKFLAPRDAAKEDPVIAMMRRQADKLFGLGAGDRLYPTAPGADFSAAATAGSASRAAAAGAGSSGTDASGPGDGRVLRKK